MSWPSDNSPPFTERLDDDRPREPRSPSQSYNKGIDDALSAVLHVIDDANDAEKYFPLVLPITRKLMSMKRRTWMRKVAP